MRDYIYWNVTIKKGKNRFLGQNIWGQINFSNLFIRNFLGSLFVRFYAFIQNSSLPRAQSPGPDNSNPRRLDRRHTCRSRIRCSPPLESAHFFVHLVCSSWLGIPKWYTGEDSCCCKYRCLPQYVAWFRCGFGFGNQPIPGVRLVKDSIFLWRIFQMLYFLHSH